MKVKDITIAALLLILAVVSYFLGFQRGARQEQLKSDARFLISAHQTLYRSAENGDLQKIQNILAMVILGEVRSYQLQFGDESGTNGFAQRFNDAKLIADAVESRLVPVGTALTNIPLTPNAKITVTKEQPEND
jgi:hypothetical protein